METLRVAFDVFTASVSALPNQGAYGLSYFQVLHAINNAWLLRNAMTVEVHWLRLLLIHILLVSGGGTLVHMLLGKAVPLVSNPLILTSTFLAYILVFHCPGDVFAPVIRSEHTRPVWRAVAAIHIALSAVGGVVDAYSVNAALPAWSAVLFGILSGVGGSLTVEITNAMLLHPTVYTQPRNGPSPGAVNALWFSVLFIALRSSAAVQALNFLTGGHWKSPSLETARALVVATSLALTFAEVPLPALTAKLFARVPGLKSTFVPLAMEVERSTGTSSTLPSTATTGQGMGSTQPTWPLADGIFGYEYDPYEDYDMDVVFLAGDDGDDEEAETEPVAASGAGAGKSPAKPSTPPSSARGRGRAGSAAKGSAKRR